MKRTVAAILAGAAAIAGVWYYRHRTSTRPVRFVLP